MPVNNGYFNRKARKEGALGRRLANIEAYKGDETKKTKLSTAQKEVESLKQNIQMPKKGRSW